MTIDIPTEKLETALHVLELALHPSTCDTEAISAVHGFRRVAKGMPLTVICEHLYGDGVDLDGLVEGWGTRLANSMLEISRLRDELRRTKKSLDDSRRPGSSQNDPVKSKSKEIPPLILDDVEWTAIEGLIPEIYQTEKGRDRISAIVGVLRTNCGWRVLDPDGGNKWTTYYNQYRVWQYEVWWIELLRVLTERACGT